MNDIDEQLKEAQLKWLEHMKAFKNIMGVIELPITLMLTEKHIENCRLLPHREAILQRMKVQGVAAEVGVQTGNFL